MSPHDLIERIEARRRAVRQEIETLMMEDKVLSGKTAGLRMCDHPDVVVAKLLAELPEGNPLRVLLELERMVGVGK